MAPSLGTLLYQIITWKLDRERNKEYYTQKELLKSVQSLKERWAAVLVAVENVCVLIGWQDAELFGCYSRCLIIRSFRFWIRLSQIWNNKGSYLLLPLKMTGNVMINWQKSTDLHSKSHSLECPTSVWMLFHWVQVRSLCHAFCGNFLSSQSLQHTVMWENTFVNKKWSAYQKRFLFVYRQHVCKVWDTSRLSATPAHSLFLDDVSGPGLCLWAGQKGLLSRTGCRWFSEWKRCAHMHALQLKQTN